MTKPAVFISHRQADEKIAKIVADFLDERSSHNARIFVSSSADFGHPAAGENLVASLKRELAASDVVVLIFTTDGAGWSWCMWECGVATDPKEERPTKVVVLQCGEAAPGPYVDQLRVDVRNLEALTGFVRAMLTSTEYFPLQAGPLTGYAPEDPHIREFAEELYQELGQAIVELHAPEAEERAASTYLCVELDREAVAELKAVPPLDPRPIVAERGRIVHRQGANTLFGFHVAPGTTLGQLADEGTGAAAGGRDAKWLASLVDQVRTVVCGKYPVVPWAPYSVEPSKCVIPYVAGSRTVPTTGGVQVFVYFVPMSPRPVPVRERMISPQQMFHKNLADTPGASILLVDLLAEMKADRRSRVPMLGEDGRPKFMVHLSMIVEFVSERALAGDADVKMLTVHDLLDDATRADTYRTTFAVVGPDADMDQALVAMNQIQGCQDVFVTEDGTKDAPVLGWLTNTMFTT